MASITETVELSENRYALVNEGQVMIVTRGRDADFEELDEPLTRDDLVAMLKLFPAAR